MSVCVRERERKRVENKRCKRRRCLAISVSTLHMHQTISSEYWLLISYDTEWDTIEIPVQNMKRIYVRKYKRTRRWFG